MLVTVMMECLTLYYPWIQRYATVLAGLLTANPTLGFVHERRGMAVCARSACTDVILQNLLYRMCLERSP